MPSTDQKWREGEIGLVVVSMALYIGLGLVACIKRPFWFDEVLTVWVAQLPARDIWIALAQGADGQPPLLHVFVHGLLAAGIPIRLAARVPSLLAFGLFMVCAYLLARPYVRRPYALACAFVPFYTSAGWFATEARGYAGMLGYSAAAILLWRRAVSGKHRFVTVVGVGVAIAVAVSHHYLALLIVPALCIGEFCRFLRSRKIDWPLLIAILGGAVPVWLYRPLIESQRATLPHFWARPGLVGGMEQNVLFYGGALIAALVFGGMAWVRLHRNARVVADRLPPTPEIAVMIFLACSPLWACVIGRFSGGAFTPRYGMDALIGLSFLIGIAADRAVPSGRFGVGLLAVGWLMCAGSLLVRAMGAPTLQPEVDWTTSKLIPNTTGPIAISSPYVFAPLYLSASQPVRRRLLYVDSPELAFRFQATETPEWNLRFAAASCRLPVLTMDQFRAIPGSVTVVADSSTWLLPALRQGHSEVHLLSEHGRWSVYRVVPSSR